MKENLLCTINTTVQCIDPASTEYYSDNVTTLIYELSPWYYFGNIKYRIRQIFPDIDPVSQTDSVNVRTIDSIRKRDKQRAQYVIEQMKIHSKCPACELFKVWKETEKNTSISFYGKYLEHSEHV